MIAVDDRCGSCGAAVAATAKFCSECGTPLRSPQAAEHKQVAVVFGPRDRHCTPASARAFASRIPNARLRLLADVGHFTPTEAPTEAADELKSLLQPAQ